MKKRMLFLSLTMLTGLGMLLSSAPQLLNLESKKYDKLTENDHVVTKTTADLATANSWANGTQYTSFKLDDHVTISVSGGGNTGKYYTSGQNYRLYQNENATITAAVSKGYVLSSITYTYTTDKGGVLINGTNSVSSETVVKCNSNSMQLSVGNTSSGTNGQVRITKFSVTYTATSEATKYLVTFYNGENFFDSVGVIEGTTVSEPANVPTKPSDSTYNYHFEAWCTDSELNNEYDFSTPVTGDLELYAKFTPVKITEDLAKSYDTKASLSYKYDKSGSKTLDELDRSLTGVTGTSYSNWSGKTVSSDAVYAGNSAGGNDSIQLRSDKDKNNNYSGVVTTTSGGKAKKVTVAWNSNTASGRVLDIYGSNTAFTSTTQLYNSQDNTIVKLGSITCGTSTTFSITGDYEYIGLRSNNGAMYLSSVTIQWGEYNFDFTKVGIRFGGLMKTNDFKNLGIQGYGVMVGTTSNVESVGKDIHTIEEAYRSKPNGLSENHITDVYAMGTPYEANDTQKAELPEGDYYLWNIYVNIPESTFYKTNISAAAYIKVNDEIFFLNEKKTNLVQMANDYLTIPEYQNNYKDGSLAYLASL